MRRILAALLLLMACVGAQAESAMRIQYAEPVGMKLGTGNVSFDAYGRRFDMTLANNERVTSKLSQQRKSELGQYQILRGNLVAQPHSWFRLTEFNGRIEGAIWEAGFLRRHHARADRAYLTTPVAGAPAQTVVYRLSDTINAFPKNFCADEKIPEGKSPMAWSSIAPWSRAGCHCRELGNHPAGDRDLADRRRDVPGAVRHSHRAAAGAPQRG